MDYRCSQCGATDCKLWREGYISFQAVRLFCAACAAADQGADISDIDENGRRSFTPKGMKIARRTDQIGCYVPAVPSVPAVPQEPLGDITAYWGYAAVPKVAADWWRALPTQPAAEPLVVVARP